LAAWEDTQVMLLTVKHVYFASITWEDTQVMLLTVKHVYFASIKFLRFD